MGCCGGCSLQCRQFLLLTWKNFILQIRRPIGTFFEIILPILAAIFIVGLRFGLFSTEDRCFVTFDSDSLTIPSNVPALMLPGIPFPIGNNFYHIFYSPNTEEAEEVAEILREVFTEPTFNFTGFQNESSMVSALQAAVPPSTNFTGCFRNGAGIVFDELSDNDMSYTIRLRHEVGNQDSWRTDMPAPAFELPGPRIENFYLREGFVQLQKIVGDAIVRWKAGAAMTTPPVDVAFRQLPYPAYRVDFFLENVGSFLPIFLVMAFLYSAGTIVKELVLEKETRIRESMLMMGLKQWILWGSWYLKQFVFLLISIIVVTILMRIGMFPNSNILLLFLLMVSFILSMISFCFFVSVWFDSSRVGFIMGFVLWFVNYFPFLFLPARYDELALGAKVGACFLSNTCLGLGIEVLSRLELRQEGLNFNNFAKDVSTVDNFNMAWVFGMLLLDALLYMIIAWYVNGVKPGQYGVPKPFWFPLLPSYWCEGLRYSKVKTASTEGMVQNDPEAHEQEPRDLKKGISIKNLTKIYSQPLIQRLLDLLTLKKSAPKKAVDNLSLNMYEGQITALLGHNGAGKTTTMSILTGLYTPTSGAADINGFSILSDMDLIRRSLGICPQHNVLFDRLTVSEHLTFFLRLKGIFDSARVRKEVVDMIEDLQLVGKSKIQSSRLSGGMKRKLSVGIALIGGSEIVILDEPTSGMDPYARRATWDLLIKHKANRTMLLTTHFMDEADLLGDRIAIMAEGKLFCSGSSLFLKSRYGVGYHMTVVKEPSCVSEAVEHLIHSFVPEAKQVTDVGAELSFVLPSGGAAKFPELFDSLDAHKIELGVSSFGISITTMEEVFIKVGEGTDETLENRIRRKNTQKSLTTSPPPIGQTRSPSPRVVSPQNVVGSPVISPSKPASAAATEFASMEGAGANLPGEVPSPSIIALAENLPHSSHLEASGTVPTNDQGQLLTYTFTPNTFLVLWIQQFCAMFLKRFYNSLRFYAALVSQLFLPLLFVIFGLLVAVTVPSNDRDDPARNLVLNNAGLSPNNTLFYAQASGLDSVINFSNVSRVGGASGFLNYTMNVEGIREAVLANPKSTPSECCNYKNQILDQVCAARPADELEQACKSDEMFGYHRCINCLKCCSATAVVGTTCSRPNTTLFGSTLISNDDLCPAPPSLEIGTSPGSDSPLLQSYNTYVAEELLRRSEEDLQVFFRQIVGGFTLTERDPILSVCDCAETATDAVIANETCGILSGLASCNEDNTTTCPVYSFDPFQVPPCRADLCSLNGSCYSVDATSSDLVKTFSCPANESLTGSCGMFSERPISTVFTSQPSTPMVTVWYNNEVFHAGAAVLNAFHNIYLQQLTDMPELTLSVYNHPLPRNAESRLDAAQGDPTGFGISILVVFGFSFLMASYVLFPVTEKESKAKHLQFVSGVNVSSYWLASYAWDLINGLIPIVLAIIIFAIFDVEAYSGAGLGAVFLVLLLTCWSAIPFTYIFSFAFSNSLAAFGILMLIFFFISLFGLTIIFVIAVSVDDSENIQDALNYIFLLCPTYALSSALNDIYLNENTRGVCQMLEDQFGNGGDDFSVCKSMNVRFVENPLDVDRPGVGIYCIYLFFEGILYFLLTLLLEHKFFVPEIKQVLCGRNGNNGEDHTIATPSEPLLQGEDSDVYAERKKVLGGQTTDNDVVIIKNLVKVYSAHLSGCSIQSSKTAVNGITLAIPSGECFGLLGVNGAGKTTTFSILTGDLPLTSGTAIVAGHDIRTNIKDVQQRIGYCPQFDALLERLTGEELLTMFARLRGIPEGHIKEAVNTEIKRLDLTKYAKKLCGSYSGGNKRKLSTAIALVGNPPIVMLDEPTTGMDPATRRYLWDVLTNITREGRSIILTSHSMEECEALCTRIAIMVNGTFKCLGSIQHLKNKYGSGFTLQTKVQLSPSPEHHPQRQESGSGSIFRRVSLRRSQSRERSGSRSKPVEVPMTGGGSDEVYNEGVATTGAGLEGTGPVPEVTRQRSVLSNAAVPFNPFDTTSLHIFLREAFPGAVLLEEHQGAVTYQLPSAGVTWSTVFRQLESNKQRLGIVDYSVSQTTLDQVFINFAKEQLESDL